MSKELDFAGYVLAWHAKAQAVADAKAAMKSLVDEELAMRKALAESVKTALGDKLKEGVNNYPTTAGTLKLTHKVKREIDEAAVSAAREAYALVNDAPVTFDTLIRVKYELDKRSYDKLAADGQAKRAVDTMVTSKPQTPELVLG